MNAAQAKSLSLLEVLERQGYRSCEIRCDNSIRTILALFWVLLHTFINLTTVLYLSSLALSIVPNISMTQSIAGLFILSMANLKRLPCYPKAIEIEPGLFKTTAIFNALAIGIVLILGALYAVY